MTTREQATSGGERTIVVTREFDADRETVFKAFTDPQMLAQWFAPEPLTVPRSEADLRVGGRYTLVMRDEEGNDYTSTGEFLEIDEPERVIYSDSMEQMPSGWVDMVNDARGEAKGTPIKDGIVTVTFEEIGDKTRVFFREDFDSRATRDALVEMQMVEGLEGSYDNLDKVLAQTPSMAR